MFVTRQDAIDSSTYGTVKTLLWIRPPNMRYFICLVFFGFWEARLLQNPDWLPASILDRDLLQSPPGKHKQWQLNFDTQALISRITMVTRRYDTSTNG